MGRIVDRGCVYVELFVLLVGVCRANEAESRRVWEPRPPAADAPLEQARVRIVDFGHDFLRDGDGRPRHQFGCHRYTLEKSADSGLWSPCAKPVELDLSVDVDGDGQSDDDVVAYHEFSLEHPFSPVAPWYDRLAATPRWYGGAAIYQADRRTSGFSEDGVNHEHDGPLHRPRDNWALFHETYEIDSPYRLAAVWIWQKQDFLNGGDSFPVTFDAESTLALLLQRYFMCIDSVRFLVRDGDRFYLSEKTFRFAGQHVLHPGQTHWAPYEPKPPHDMYFDREAAEFAQHEFKDITAVGFYVSKDRFAPAYFGFKWYAFECDALAHRKQRPSEHVDMVFVRPAEGMRPAGREGGAMAEQELLSPFYMSTTEIPYELWKNVFRRARSNCFVVDPRGFNFDKDGDMGSMDLPGPDGTLVKHSLQEPVTDITFHDMAAWCNAVSTIEGRTPCYYEDAEFSTPLHQVKQCPALAKQRPTPSLHVRWDADGYRLPTAAEWQAASGKGQGGDSHAWSDANSGRMTHPVGTLQPNGFGLHDMLGNVWEAVWAFGEAYDPAIAPPITVMGGDFLWTPSAGGKSVATASAHGSAPYEGSCNIGFRVVRRASGMPAPRTSFVSSGQSVPIWAVEKTDRPVAVAGAGGSVPDVELVSIPGTQVSMATHETAFVLWKQVYDWGVARGYEFDYDGDMGSMDYWGFPGEPPNWHGPDEPVTDITFYDVAVWCNALSAWVGAKPVYYADAELRQVYRKSWEFRAPHLTLHEAEALRDAGLLRPGKGHGAQQEVFVDPSANGYRLPTQEEFMAALGAGGRRRYSWDDDPSKGAEHAWLYDNAQNTTHPVGQKMANELGLFDLNGNVSEMGAPRDAGWILFMDRMGGSFVELTLGVGRGGVSKTLVTWPYYDTGFRVVRQQPAAQKSAGVATRSALLGLSSSLAPWGFPGASTAYLSHMQPALLTAAPPVGRGRGGKDALDIDPAAFDPLQGRAHRGNLFRTGVFTSQGVTGKPSVLWKFSTGGPIKSSPVVVDGVAYFGSNDRHIYAVDVETGKERWKVGAADVVTGSAAVTGGTVYIVDEAGYLYALDAKTGDEQWKRRFSRQRPCGSPAVAYGTVFIGQGVGGGHEVVLMTAQPVVGFDADTGQQVWQGASSPQGYAAICLDGGTLYAGIGGSSFSATDLETGKLKWSKSGGAQNRQFMSMSFANDLVYAPGTITGTVIAFDPMTGNTVFNVPVWPGQTLPINNGGEPGHEIFTDVAVTDGRIYCGSNDGKLHTFDAGSGERGWTFDAGAPIQSSPSVAGGLVYFGCHDGHLYAVSAETGELAWKIKLGGKMRSAPWPGDGVVYVGCDDGDLHAVGM